MKPGKIAVFVIGAAGASLLAGCVQGAPLGSDPLRVQVARCTPIASGGEATGGAGNMASTIAVGRGRYISL